MTRAPPWAGLGGMHRTRLKALEREPQVVGEPWEQGTHSGALPRLVLRGLVARLSHPSERTEDDADVTWET
jgi:hypothetical protein